MTQMIILIDKNIKTVITLCYIFKKLKEGLNMLSKDVKNKKKRPKLKFWGVKNILDCIIGRLDITEENTSELSKFKNKKNVIIKLKNQLNIGKRSAQMLC